MAISVGSIDTDASRYIDAYQYTWKQFTKWHKSPKLSFSSLVSEGSIDTDASGISMSIDIDVNRYKCKTFLRSVDLDRSKAAKIPNSF